MEFTKAFLQEVTEKPTNPPAPLRPPIHVQINPATLRLQATASVDARKDTGHQRSQYQGTTSTLSFDLVFDTSDEGTTDVPMDVRKRTAEIERFVWPLKKASSPPRVQFTYGTLTVIGVMKSLSTDLDLFSANGVPLRAKCAVQIEEQKPAFDLKLEGPGSKAGTGATPPLQPNSPAASTGADGGPPPPTDRTGTALAGETASAFANRMGLDPRAWKGLQGITDPMSLEAGQEIDFASVLSVDTGLGTQIGSTPTAGTGTRPDGPTLLSQTELTGAGGLTRALNDATIAASAAAAAAAAGAFSTTGSARPAPTGQTPGSVAEPAGARVPEPDPRATSYGFGVPLRPRRGAVTAATVGLVHERSRTVRFGGEQPPEVRGAAVPSWSGLLPQGTPCGCGCARAGEPSCECGVGA